MRRQQTLRILTVAALVAALGLVASPAALAQPGQSRGGAGNSPLPWSVEGS